MFDPDYDCFIQIIETGSISAAARRRGVSTASLSKRLVRLEDRLATQLIHRTTRRLTLTSSGKELFELLLPIRAKLREAENRLVDGTCHIRGALRISAPTSYGRMHLLPLLPGFLETYPDVELRIDLSDEFVDLLVGKYDAAIRIGIAVDPELVGHKIGTSSRILCASRKYIERFGEPSDLAGLGEHRLLATDSQLPWHLDGPGGSVQFAGTSYVRTNSSEVVRELALEGCGIALRSLWDIGEAVRHGRVARVLPDYRGSHDAGIHVVHSRDRNLPLRVQAFVEYISRQTAESDLLPIDS
jgi:DNA-binding transcriptional LysR family regulator